MSAGSRCKEAEGLVAFSHSAMLPSGEHGHGFGLQVTQGQAFAFSKTKGCYRKLLIAFFNVVPSPRRFTDNKIYNIPPHKKYEKKKKGRMVKHPGLYSCN